MRRAIAEQLRVILAPVVTRSYIRTRSVVSIAALATDISQAYNATRRHSPPVSSSIVMKITPLVPGRCRQVTIPVVRTRCRWACIACFGSAYVASCTESLAKQRVRVTVAILGLRSKRAATNANDGPAEMLGTRSRVWRSQRITAARATRLQPLR